ncbi:hypothetical protein [uncultured Gimesia sp.]|uniref:hypothetical protein n=1 Tax=uncultured Gimesia sp. TaxID=1678688 RepID=UPI00260E1BE0|nr:hypothetical protein [uncultured Gimesia sp.]
MKILETSKKSINNIFLSILVFGLNGCGTEQKDTVTMSDKKRDQSSVAPIDVSKMAWNKELAKYLGKPVYLVGIAQSSKSSTRVSGVEIWSREGYIWPFDVVGQTVKVVGILDYHDFNLERKRVKEIEDNLGMSQHRSYREGVDGTYVIRGNYWCLWDDVPPRTKRLFETDTLSDEEQKAVWGDAVP